MACIPLCFAEEFLLYFLCQREHVHSVEFTFRISFWTGLSVSTCVFVRSDVSWCVGVGVCGCVSVLTFSDMPCIGYLPSLTVPLYLVSATRSWILACAEHRLFFFFFLCYCWLVFKISGNIHLSWISETSAFVSLYKKDNAKVGKSLKKKNWADAKPDATSILYHSFVFFSVFCCCCCCY